MGKESMNKPVILKAGSFSEVDLNNLKNSVNIFKTVDIYESQLKEIYRTQQPGDSSDSVGFEKFRGEHAGGDLAGNWIYFPWSGVLLHTVGSEELFQLRTNRNQLLVTQEEQEKLRKAVVGITGMSVGAGMAIALAHSGVSDTIKISDYDELDTSNLNRLRESLSSVGQPKATVAAEHIYDINPFADVQVFDKGVHNDNIDKFFDEPALDVIIDEIDDFRMKVRLRAEAKKRHIPVLMFSSLGDNILIDVERFDTEPELEIFHGVLGALPDEIANNQSITAEDEKRYAVLLVGQEFVPTRALATLKEMGKTLVGRPQLYSTIAVDSGLATYLVRKIILGEKLTSGRYFVKFAELFNLPSTDLARGPEREQVLKALFG